MTQLTDIKTKASEAIAAANTTAELEALRVQYLGKKGEVTELLKTLGTMAPEERKSFGAAVNEVKALLEALIDNKKSILDIQEMNAALAADKVDITLPARPYAEGRIHPISKVIQEITDIFARQDFSVAVGPDIEDDEHNFTALNIAEHHPARQMHDTFYLHGKGDGKTVLRTHTSPVQIRTMRNNKPPMRFIAPGSTYRSDSDQTHTPMFHQVEGFVIDKGIHMGHLKGCLHDFLKAFFELDEVPIRFRPSFFPFTEPSSEVDIGCKRSKDSLEIGKGDDWLEVLGCGMIHPNVLRNGGIDPNEYQGFAFGMGVERLAMLKYGIPDLRMFFESDVRWLEHYGFAI
jgi:phenylalanyl-tRNA synthetase alpha chain